MVLQQVGQLRRASSRITTTVMVLAVVALAALFLAPGAGAVTASITEYPDPPANAGAMNIAAGPDGNLWFTEFNGNNIGRITTAGVITKYSIATSSAGPLGITAGPDGNLWFIEYNANNIARITPSGVITEYAIPTASSQSNTITVGPDGNLWFTESAAGQIGRIDPTTGTITEFLLPGGGGMFGPRPNGITSGADGNLWVSASGSTPIWRLTTSGTFTAFSLAGGSSAGSITAGADGNLWFIGSGRRIASITTGGVATFYPLPGSAQLAGLTAGPGGMIWFTDNGNSGAIGSVDSAGTVTEYPIPTVNSAPRGITNGPGNTVWFTEVNPSQIGRVAVVTPPAPPTSPSATSGPDTVTVSWAAPTNNGGAPVTSYLVRYRAVGASAFVNLASTTSLSTTVTGLSPSTNYEFQIAATNSEGTGGFTPLAPVATLAAPVTTAPVTTAPVTTAPVTTAPATTAAATTAAASNTAAATSTDPGRNISSAAAGAAQTSTTVGAATDPALANTGGNTFALAATGAGSVLIGLVALYLRPAGPSRRRKH